MGAALGAALHLAIKPLVEARPVPGLRCPFRASVRATVTTKKGKVVQDSFHSLFTCFGRGSVFFFVVPIYDSFHSGRPTVDGSLARGHAVAHCRYLFVCKGHFESAARQEAGGGLESQTLKVGIPKSVSTLGFQL